jgi:hypothetical protein
VGVSVRIRSRNADEETVRIASFAETAVVWRFLDDTIMGAIR